MKLVLAEKPSQGAVYANALGANDKKDGFMEGNGYIVTWCVGHLVELATADMYDEKYKKWSIADLPIIPDKWQYVVSDDKIKQFKAVKNLLNDNCVTEVIFATDAGREGELIARLVYEQSNCTKPIKRAWLSSMEEKAILDSFSNLKDGKEFDNLYSSALCRSKADWLVGINATRLFTKLYNKKLNVGRVQTPTLSLICERDFNVTNFVKEKYWNVHLGGFATLEKVKSHEQAEEIRLKCNGNTGVVKTVFSEQKSIAAPKLYDLTTLQREANRLFGFTAQQTLDYTQSLYEMRLVTYPRTDSQYLTDDMQDTVIDVIDIVMEFTPLFNGIGKYNFTGISKVLNSKKVTDHTAIIPTAELAKIKLDSIPDGEKKILFLIASRLVCAVSDKHEYTAITGEIECNGYTFTAKGKTVTAEGWKKADRLFKNFMKCKSDEDANNFGTNKTPENTLNIHEGETFTNVKCNISEHFTSPPKHFAEDTLLSAMERAGSEEVTEKAERSGLGTPATRASIIEKLINSGFVKRDKKNLIATNEGKELIAVMPDFIKSAKLTADWENNLSLISQGQHSANDFMDGIKNLIYTILPYAKENVKNEFVVATFHEKETLGKCPRCGKDVTETPKTYSCGGGRDGCGFALWKSNKFFESAKKAFTKEIAIALINDGKCEVNGLYSAKTDKTYSAVISLEDTGTFVNFKLSFPKRRK